MGVKEVGADIELPGRAVPNRSILPGNSLSAPTSWAVKENIVL
jgi:hypothetical protein